MIVSHVNALPGSEAYGVLYTTALRFLEKDPFQEVAFAVWTHSDATISQDDLPALELHLWNETWVIFISFILVC